MTNAINIWRTRLNLHDYFVHFCIRLFHHYPESDRVHVFEYHLISFPVIFITILLVKYQEHSSTVAWEACSTDLFADPDIKPPPFAA